MSIFKFERQVIDSSRYPFGYSGAIFAFWLGEWANRIPLTIDHAKIDSDLTHFPVPIVLTGTDAEAVITEVGSGSKKIAVGLPDKTQLYCEIEQWDTTNNKITLWASRSDWVISSTEDTTLYLYYDETQDDNLDYIGDPGDVVAQNVWNSDFAARYGMAQDPSGGADCIIDSTVNANHGTPSGSMTSDDLVDGEIGKAINFDGSDDYIDCGSDNSLNPGEGSFTVESLVKTNGKSTYGDYRDNMSVVSKGTTGDNPLYNLLIISESNGYLQATIEGSGDQVDLAGSVSAQDNIYHNIAMVVNRATSEMEVFFDGSADTNTGFSNVGDINPSQSFKIGTYASSPYEYYYKDIIAELRISNTVRSADWIKADYHAQTNTLLTAGEHEVL
jgi:hypothetical protein